MFLSLKHCPLEPHQLPVGSGAAAAKAVASRLAPMPDVARTVIAPKLRMADDRLGTAAVASPCAASPTNSWLPAPREWRRQSGNASFEGKDS